MSNIERKNYFRDKWILNLIQGKGRDEYCFMDDKISKHVFRVIYYYVIAT